MTQKYIGVKMVDAWEQEQNGVPGYAVKYPDDLVRISHFLTCPQASQHSRGGSRG